MQTKQPLNNAAFVITTFFLLLLVSQTNFAQSGDGRTPKPKKSAVSSKQIDQKPKPKKTVAVASATRSTPQLKKAKPQEKNISNKRQLPAQVVAKKRGRAPNQPNATLSEKKQVAVDKAKTEIEPPESYPIEGMLPVLKSSTEPIIAVKMPKKVLEVREYASRRPMPIVRIQQVSVEPNVYEDGIKGVAVSVKFRVSNLEGVEAKVVANFYPEKKAVSFSNVSQISESDINQTFVEEVFTPATEVSYYDNFTLFMPYEKLEQAYENLDAKPLRIKMQIQIRELDDSILASSRYTRLIVQ